MTPTFIDSCSCGISVKTASDRPHLAIYLMGLAGRDGEQQSDEVRWRHLPGDTCLQHEISNLDMWLRANNLNLSMSFSMTTRSDGASTHCRHCRVPRVWRRLKYSASHSPTDCVEGVQGCSASGGADSYRRCSRVIGSFRRVMPMWWMLVMCMMFPYLQLVVVQMMSMSMSIVDLYSA